MKEYYGKSAKLYQQTNGKKYLLFPGIKRAIPKTKDHSAKLLDIACGNADFYPLIVEKGYQYTGLDISADMIGRAKAAYPQGNYLVASSTNFSTQVKEKYDVILITMLFPAFSQKEEITRTLKECKKVLKKDGIIIIGVSHPHFDCYMRKGLFGLDYVEADFTGYFTSGKNLLIHKKFDKGIMTFEDYHWTLQDYISCITKAEMVLTSIDECPPTNSPKEFREGKKQYPTYLVMVCR